MKLINILLVVPALAACGSVVNLPVVQDVDVFVVGGGVGAVSAACAAKAAGASVFLAAPRPQLGEDICGKLRLRREPGDDERHALYAAIFAPDLAPRELAPYTYSYENPPTSGVDDSACTRLKDGRCVNLAKDGVGFDDSVFVRVDLGSVQEVSGVEVDYFSRGKPAAKWRKVPKDLHNKHDPHWSADERGRAEVVQMARPELAPGIGGRSIAPGRIPPPIKGHDNAVGNHERSLVLRELCLARALYRLGDDDSGLGRRTLEAYSRDPRRAYASHARLVLAPSAHLQ